MKPGPTRVLIVAESDARAAIIEASLRDAGDLQIAVGRSRTLGRLIEEHGPSVVVLAASARRLGPYLDIVVGALRSPPVVLLVDDPRTAWRSAARRAGVHAVLGSDPAIDQLTAAIRAAAVGLITVHPDALSAAVHSTSGEPGDGGVLTTREREILELMAEGLSNRMVARRLGISTYTVKFHVASILAKLRASSRTEAVTLGIRQGLISL